MKILIIAHNFPPLNTMGTQRPYSWVKYWTSLGHEVCVITTKKASFDGPLNLILEKELAEKIKIIEIEYLPFKSFKKKKKLEYKYSKHDDNSRGINLIKKIVRKMRNVIGSLIDIHDLWIYPATKEATKLYKEWKFELVVSTYSPPAAHVIGSKLKNKLNLFWVADYRDLWHGNHVITTKWPLTIIEDRIEKKVLRNANIITTVSEPFKEKILRRFNKKVFVFENGFDTSEIKKVKNDYFKSDEIINLVYTGNLYPVKQNPNELFKAVSILKSKIHNLSSKLQIHFFGLNLEGVKEVLQEFNIMDIVKIEGFKDREKILYIQRSSNYLLFFDWEDENFDGILPGKLFEYLFSNKPIISLGKNMTSVSNNIIKEVNIGLVIENNSDTIVKLLLDILDNKIKKFVPEEKILNKYTRKKIAEDMIVRIIEEMRT